MQSSEEEKLIFALSQGAEHCLMTYQAYDINGYTFYTDEKESNCDYQNSGVTMEAYTGDVKQRYYGRIEETWELSYAGEKVPMFRVRWAKNVVKEDRYFTTMVIPEAISKTAGANVTMKNEPWVLASQVDQCFFITDLTKPTRVVMREEKGTSSEWMELPTSKTLTCMVTQRWKMKETTMNHTPQEEVGPPYLKIYRSREEVSGFRGLII
jgi:hypothetical protein